MIKDSPTELITIASDESLNSQTVLGYSVRSVLPDEDPDEIQELNESLRRSSSIREVIEISSMAPSAGGETEVEKIFTNKSGKLVLPPDGDYGWVSVFCLTAVQFSTWGANAGSTSVLLSFYIDNDVFHGASSWTLPVSLVLYWEWLKYQKFPSEFISPHMSSKMLGFIGCFYGMSFHSLVALWWCTHLLHMQLL